MPWSEIVATSFATLFVVIDPIGLVPLFLALTPQSDKAERRRIAWRAMLASLVVLVIFALFGDAVLSFLGIGLPAFRIAGGILLFVLALEMLFEKRTARRERNVAEAQAEHAADTQGPSGASEDDEDISVFPLAVPLIAGPGAITSILLLMSHHQGDYAAQALVVAVMVAVLALTLVFFLAAGWFGHHLGPTLIRALTRVLGVILAALAMQFILTGLQNAGF